MQTVGKVVVSTLKEATGRIGKRPMSDQCLFAHRNMIVPAVTLIARGIFFMSLQPALKDTSVTKAYNTTLMTLRRARKRPLRSAALTWSRSTTRLCRTRSR